MLGRAGKRISSKRVPSGDSDALPELNPSSGNSGPRRLVPGVPSRNERRSRGFGGGGLRPGWGRRSFGVTQGGPKLEGRDTTAAKSSDVGEGVKVGGAKLNHRFLEEFWVKVESGEGLSSVENAQIWHDFMYASDPDAEALDVCGGLNGNQLRGVLLACNTALNERKRLRLLTDADRAEDPMASWEIGDFLEESEEAHVVEGAVAKYTAREFRDVLEAMQLHMLEIIQREGANNTRGALMALFARFGFLAMRAFEEKVMDDPSFCTKIASENPAENYFIFTCKALRTHSCVFLVLFRAVEIWDRRVQLEHVPIPPRGYDEPDPGGAPYVDLVKELGQEGVAPRVPEYYIRCVCDMIKAYHQEAANDYFNELQMYYALKPAQRLIYSHNYRGLFNNISQVIYFHSPDWVRSAPMELSRIRESDMNALPALCSILPKTPVLFDDGAAMPFGNVLPGVPFWLVSLSRTYLWCPKSKRLLQSNDGNGVMDLCAYLILVYHGPRFFTVQSGDDDRRPKSGAGDTGLGALGGVKRTELTESGHARIIRGAAGSGANAGWGAEDEDG